MTLHMVHISSNRAEKRKIKEIQYVTFDHYDDLEECKMEEIIQFIEKEDYHNAPNKLA